MKVKNRKTGEVIQIERPDLDDLEEAVLEGIDMCVGPCECSIEPDGQCPKGWPSRLIVCGII